MKPSDALIQHREKIRAIIFAHHGLNPRVFGSTVRGEDTEKSDLDILIDPMPETTFFDIGAMRRELRLLLGVAVDILTPRGLPEKIRIEVLSEAVAI
ncbi:nucleotidyltransferase family protein [Actimicrobium sp. CCI2.3]|uniref:nucleotidyltransferase family protein n=1 Tax=Actimicrobium sp. CCI2.3 TaxID=3048616 RepID=UPI002AB5AA0D|nr:nucleotidyltransferase family protein [Actimicrobium sp. CCI2.3]MDY7572909.1 nucleotidyltransferase family protein [Actimicrobium sp. CCI2.3]MEB0020754.1 nucleotidyltransferase family protein [Actimicrobium sp. CCI2.3]